MTTNPTAAPETCGNCRFRSDGPYTNPDRGTAEFADIMFACKRRAPVATGGMMSPSNTIWPMVAKDDWCGEWQAKSPPAFDLAKSALRHLLDSDPGPRSPQTLAHEMAEVARQALAEPQTGFVSEITPKMAEIFREYLASSVNDSTSAPSPVAVSETPVGEQLRAELEREEAAHGQTIGERDDAEQALSQAYFLVTGNSPQWSNMFGYKEALEEIDDAQRAFRTTISELRGCPQEPTPAAPDPYGPAIPHDGDPVEQLADSAMGDLLDVLAELVPLTPDPVGEENYAEAFAREFLPNLAKHGFRLVRDLSEEEREVLASRLGR